MRKLAILLGGALALAACNTTPATPPPGAMIDPNDPRFAPGFLATAGSANQFEVESSQLALQVSQNPGVRALASTLIADHTALGQQVAAAAISAHLQPPPPTLLPSDQALLDQLRATGGGTNFDMLYRQDQINAHNQAIALMQTYATGGDVSALRAVASQAIPMMQRHLAMAQALQIAVAPPPPPPMPAPSPRRAGERG